MGMVINQSIIKDTDIVNSCCLNYKEKAVSGKPQEHGQMKNAHQCQHVNMFSPKYTELLLSAESYHTFQHPAICENVSVISGSNPSHMAIVFTGQW